MGKLDKSIWKLSAILILLMAAVLFMASCTCGDNGDDDINDDTDNDDTNDDDDTDDDDNDDNDTDDDSEGWYIYTIDASSAGSTSIGVDQNKKVHVAYGYSALKYVSNTAGTWQAVTIDSARIWDNGRVSLAINSNIDFCINNVIMGIRGGYPLCDQKVLPI